jgi:hypothetical protein
MSFTAQSVIDRARLIWKEAETNDRFDDPQCLVKITDGVNNIRSFRPESQIDDFGNTSSAVDIASAGESISLDVKFRPALAYYLAAQGFFRDSDSQNHGERAAANLALFEKELATV